MMRAAAGKESKRSAIVLLVACLVWASAAAALETSARDAAQELGEWTATWVWSGPEQGPLQAILDAAPSGSVVRVIGGVHPAITIGKPLRLIGVDGPIIDAGGEGTAVTVRADDVRIQGFTVRNTGSSLDREDSAILVEGARSRIVDNVITDALFGIYLKQSPDSVIAGNTIRGKPLPEPRRGDGIRVWYSPNTVVRENVVTGARDVLLWFSGNALIEENVVSDGRYGIHLMYNDETTIRRNTLSRNSVGCFVMYSRAVTVEENDLRMNRGPSGFGLGLKDLDEVEVGRNRFTGNRVGLFLDNTPRLGEGARSVVTHNRFDANDIGVSAHASIGGNTFVGNAFVDNMQQVAVIGGSGLHLRNRFSAQEQGNYWSDYAGYDGNGDGVGELSYESSSLFERWMDDFPVVRWFLMSPSMSAVDLAVRAFPAFRPPARVVDPHPLTRIPVETPMGETAGAHGRDLGLLALSFGLAAPAAFLVSAVVSWNRTD